MAALCGVNVVASRELREQIASSARRARRSMRSASWPAQAALSTSRGDWQQHRSNVGMRSNSSWGDLQEAMASGQWGEALRSFGQSFDASEANSDVVIEAYSRLIQGGCRQAGPSRGEKAVVTLC